MIFDFHEVFNSLTHLLWAVAALPAGYYLVKSRRSLSTKVTAGIFILTVIACYLSSFAYHAVAPEYVHMYKMCDHITIFLLIAGTYTPIIWHYCDGIAKYNILLTTWALALLGIWLRILFPYSYDFMYLVAGWGTLLIYMDMAKDFLRKDMILIAIGGLCYTIGALIEFNEWYGTWHHEIFHLFVMGGTLCHYLFIWRYVNYDRPAKVYKFRA